MMAASLRYVCLLGVGAFVALVSVIGRPAAGQDTVSTDYIPAEALAAAVLYPNEVLANPEFELMPIEIAQAWSIENIGVDILEIESVTASVGIPGPAGVEFGMVVRLTKDLNPRLLKRDLFAGPAEDVNGYQAIPIKDLPNAYLNRVDAKTYIIATPDHLASMLANNSSGGQLSTLLTSKPRSTSLMVAMVFEPIREQINQLIDQMPPNIPGPLADLVEIPRLAEGMLMEAAGGNAGMVRLTMVGGSDAAAEEIRMVLQNGLNFGRDLAVMQAMEGIQGNDRVAQASRQYIQRLATSISGMLTPKLEDKFVIIEAQAEGSMAFSGIAIGLLLPAVQAAREAARRMSSSNNLKQLMLSLHNYHDAFGKLPAAASRDEDGKPLLSWRVAVLPFLEEAALYQEFHLDEPWDSEHNIKLLDRMPLVFRDPSLALEPGMTNYLATVGEGLGWEVDQQLHFRDFTDGLSNTIALYEGNAESAVSWTKPDEAIIDPADPLATTGTHRPGGFNFARFDGSVQFMPNTIAIETFWAMLTRAGGERTDF